MVLKQTTHTQHTGETVNDLILLAAEQAHEGAELPMDPIWFGLTALGILLFSGIITLSWRGISYRH